MGALVVVRGGPINMHQWSDACHQRPVSLAERLTIDALMHRWDTPDHYECTHSTIIRSSLSTDARTGWSDCTIFILHAVILIHRRTGDRDSAGDILIALLLNN